MPRPPARRAFEDAELGDRAAIGEDARTGTRGCLDSRAWTCLRARIGYGVGIGWRGTPGAACYRWLVFERRTCRILPGLVNAYRW
jgi:hypothetical protein